MLRRRVISLVSGLVLLAAPFLPTAALACGHDGVYFGLGFEEMYMVTTEHRLGAGNQPRVHFSPGFGANAILGYDFCGSRWGIQAPFEYSRQKFDYAEWVDQFNISFEGVVHLAEWSNGVDIRLVGGAGWSYLSEGKLSNRSTAKGIIAQFGPGLAYYFSRTEKVSAALVAELPFRMIHYFGENLSSHGTTLFAVPLRLSLQVGF